MLEVKFENVLHIRKRFDEVRDQLTEITPSLEAAVQRVLQNAFREVLDAEGIPRWVKLSPYTLREKQRLGYGNKRILERTGRLRRSYLGNSADAAWRRTAASIIYENRLGYAALHERGGERLPARQTITGILEKKAVRRGISEAIQQEFRKQQRQR